MKSGHSGGGGGVFTRDSFTEEDLHRPEPPVRSTRNTRKIYRSTPQLDKSLKDEGEIEAIFRFANECMDKYKFVFQQKAVYGHNPD